MAKTKRRLEWEAKTKKQIQEQQEFDDWFLNCTEEELYAWGADLIVKGSKEKAKKLKQKV